MDKEGQIGILGVQVAVYHRSHRTGSEQLINLCMERDAKEKWQAREGHMVSLILTPLITTGSQST